MRLADVSEPAALALWRAVEAQHVVATMRLVDTRDEQLLLEQLLEGNKPPLAAGTAHLHYLLATPFRYRSPFGSRFRTPHDPGVLYGAEAQRTACAELGYWRWRFLLDSPSLGHLDTTAQTVFRLRVRGLAIDLRRPPLVSRRLEWTDPAHYGPCQALGSEARDAGVALVRYESVRDPEHGGCIAVLDPAAISHPDPVAREIWYLLVTRERARWMPGDHGRHAAGWQFEAQAWGATP